ncbi:MAG: hypothetical protein RIR94_1281, partial [Bacteroidota bacterium]
LSCLQQFFKDVIVKDYHPNENWPAEIQGGAGVIVALEDVSNERYYFMEDVLVAEDGKKYVVCNQWGSSNFEAFIERAVAMGYPIENNQGEASESHQETVPPTASPKTQKLQIEISGLIQQILQGTCEDSNDTDYLEENPYDGIHTNFYKFDSDNLIKISLDDSVIFEKEIKSLDLIACRNTDQVSSWDDDKLEALYQQISSNSKFQTKNEHDESCLYIQPKSHIFLIEDTADNSKQSVDEIAIDQRYALIDYGWYHLKSYPIEVSDFQMNHLVFIKDSNVIDFTGSDDSDEIYYAFTNLFYCDGKQIEFEIIENQSKSLDVIQGWVQDV